MLGPETYTFSRKVIGVRELTKKSLALRLRISGGGLLDTFTPQGEKFNITVGVNVHLVDEVFHAK